VDINIHLDCGFLYEDHRKKSDGLTLSTFPQAVTLHPAASFLEFL
jgi:hypothetical protein